MHDDVAVPVALDERRAQIERRDLLAGDRIHPDDALRKHCQRRDRIEHAQIVERPRGVRRELQAGAELAELRRLLQHAHGQPTAREGECDGKAADPAAEYDDRNTHLHRRVRRPGLAASQRRRDYKRLIN